MDVRPTWTDCDEAEDYVMPNVLSLRDLVSRPDNMNETVPHRRSSRAPDFTYKGPVVIYQLWVGLTFLISFEK